MALRILLFGIGLWVGYASRRWGARRGSRAPTLPQAIAGGCVLLLVCWAAWQFVAWLFFLPRNLLHYAPIDALVVGMAAGWILADHQADAERPGPDPQQAPSTGGAPPDDAAASAASTRQTHGPARPDLQWLASLASAARTTITSLGLLILALLGLAPPHFWSQIFERLEGFKAAGLEVTLGTVAGQDVAQSILASGTATEVLGPTSREERHGFIKQRLERIHNLTHPHDPEKTDETTLGRDPTLLLYVPVQSPHPRRNDGAGGGVQSPQDKASQNALPPPRDIARDRALLLHLHLGAEATDTRRRSPPERMKAMVTELSRLAKAQEQFLARLAPHVACIREVVEETSDRRLLEYQTARVVEELYLVTRLWSSLERAHTRRHLKGLRPHQAGADATTNQAHDDAAKEIRKAEDELRTHANRLSHRLGSFAWWADETILVWRAGRPGSEGVPSEPAPRGDSMIGQPHRRNREWAALRKPTTAGGAAGQTADALPATGGGSPYRPDWLLEDRPRLRPASKHCDFRQETVRAAENYLLHNLPAAADAGAATRSDLGQGGFTPYLTIFVAQALSAMGDHTAALRMLVAWQDDLKELIAVAKGEDVDAQGPARRPGTPPRDAERSRQIEHFLRAAEWFELMTFVEILILQNLSENTELALPPTEEGARHAVSRLFPAVFSRISQDTSLRDWRAPTILSCRNPTNAWRQGLVLSYASFVKTYLDIRNKKLIRPDDITIADIEFADILEQLNLECFPDQIEPKDFPRQRAQFALTAAAIKLNLLITNRLSSDHKHDLQHSLQNLMRRTLWELGRSEPSTEGLSPLGKLVFSREDELLSSAKSIKARLDTFASR